MKKIMMLAALALMAVSASAACVSWKVTGTSATNGAKVYVLTSMADSYASVDALASSAVASATISKSGVSYTTGNQTASGADITKASMENSYIVLVTSDSSYTYVKDNWSAMVYDPDNQESSPGTATWKAADIASTGTSKAFGGNVPEPTTGLLILIGLAGLGLKRKIA